MLPGLRSAKNIIQRCRQVVFSPPCISPHIFDNLKTPYHAYNTKAKKTLCSDEWKLKNIHFSTGRPNTLPIQLNRVLYDVCILIHRFIISISNIIMIIAVNLYIIMIIGIIICQYKYNIFPFGKMSFYEKNRVLLLI